MVAQEGNRRKGGMTKSEVSQAVLDVCTWFERNSPDKLVPTDPAKLEGLEKVLGFEIPMGLSLLLEKGGGGVWFYERQGFGSDKIASQAAKLGENIIPFASDVDGNLYVIDCGRRGAVFEWDSDGRGTEVASSFEDFLEQLRNDLLSNKFEFVEDCGVVEGLSSGKVGESKGGK
eukprot:CAMPEP_0171593768 /NCGR_PEP_ID=MMETSP0990-20121206/309_1 /TAXON_ID=483369 /ORGANISM="non described non described, Strain CCMP2098" /LENGTH=173 /DNA_ID=CAMNT_0012154367 /DNA_START=105 /DNA_END=626 /DNA_ORIENTATION=+